MTKAVVLYTPAEPMLTVRPPTAVRTLGEIIARSTSGELSSRKVKRLGTTVRHVEDLSASLTGLADDCNRMTADAAACANGRAVRGRHRRVERRRREECRRTRRG